MGLVSREDKTVCTWVGILFNLALNTLFFTVDGIIGNITRLYIFVLGMKASNLCFLHNIKQQERELLRLLVPQHFQETHIPMYDNYLLLELSISIDQLNTLEKLFNASQTEGTIVLCNIAESREQHT